MYFKFTKTRLTFLVLKVKVIRKTLQSKQWTKVMNLVDVNGTSGAEKLPCDVHHCSLVGHGTAVLKTSTGCFMYFVSVPN